MKKIIKKISAVATLLWSLPVTVLAANPFGSTAFDSMRRAAGFADSGPDTFEETLGRIIFAITSFIGILFILLVFYGGYVWMNARGDESQVRKAKTIIRDAIIGLIILVASYSIWIFIETLLGL